MYARADGRSRRVSLGPGDSHQPAVGDWSIEVDSGSVPPGYRLEVTWWSRVTVRLITGSRFGPVNDESPTAQRRLEAARHRIPELRSGVRVGGMTLIELMVAMALGSFLLLGAMTVLTQGQAAFRVNESTARLQEHARLALAFLEDDLRMAGHFGLTTRPGDIANRASPAQPVPPGLAVRGDCGRNWAIDLDARWREPTTASVGPVARRPVRLNPTPIRWRYGVPAKSRRRQARRGEAPCYVRTARFGPGIIFDGVAPPPEPPAEPPLQSRSFHC